MVAALALAPALAQTPLTLEQAGERSPARDFAPVHNGESVAVRGVVNAPAFHFPDHTLLAIEDGKYGAILKVAAVDQRLDRFRPGDELSVRGAIAAFSGMAVIQPDAVEKIGVKAAPVPVEVGLKSLIGFRYLGRLVRTEARAQTVADTANGGYISVQAPERFLVFLPRAANQPTVLHGIGPGDRIHVTGVAYQYCSRPPYNRYFQLLVQDPAYIVPLPGGILPSPFALGSAVFLVLAVLFVVWSRERRSRRQRERLRKTYKLGEEVLAAESAEAVLKRLRDALPDILKLTGIQIYNHNRASQTLDSVALEGETSLSLPLALTPGEPAPAAVWCFQYRTQLAIPDPERSPFLTRNDDPRRAKSLLFVPMLAQAEVIGVLELDRRDRARAFSPAEQELAQHLANQAAVAIRLLDQKVVQEQLFRTEKLAAVGRLISGVVNELRAPLESIQELTHRALGKAYNAVSEHELEAIDNEARKAARIVARLVSYASMDQANARPVNVGEVLRKLIEFREGDWKASGIRVRDLTSRDAVTVLGSEEQLEQVFLNLLIHAEQALAETPNKVITVRTSVLAKRLLVEISFSSPPISRRLGETAAVLGVTRGVVGGHGGEVRLIEKSNAEPRFEIELPVSSKDRTGPAPQVAGPGVPLDATRRLTALVIENEEAAQRHLLAMLSARGFRVVPVDNADSGLDLAHRMRFDVAFCSVHAPGLNWVELSERMRPRVGMFALVSDRYDAELAANFEGEGRVVLARPIEDAAIERVVQALAPSAQTPGRHNRTA